MYELDAAPEFLAIIKEIGLPTCGLDIKFGDFDCYYRNSWIQIIDNRLTITKQKLSSIAPPKNNQVFIQASKTNPHLASLMKKTDEALEKRRQAYMIFSIDLEDPLSLVKAKEFISANIHQI